MTNLELLQKFERALYDLHRSDETIGREAREHNERDSTFKAHQFYKRRVDELRTELQQILK
jgi:Tfp pilus assembly protein PilF